MTIFSLCPVSGPFMIRHSLPLYFPQWHWPAKMYSSPMPLQSPMFSFALAPVLPVARCILSGWVFSSCAKAYTLSTVFPARTAPSAMLYVFETHFRIYSLCFSFHMKWSRDSRLVSLLSFQHLSCLRSDRVRIRITVLSVEHLIGLAQVLKHIVGSEELVRKCIGTLDVRVHLFEF